MHEFRLDRLSQNIQASHRDNQICELWNHRFVLGRGLQTAPLGAVGLDEKYGAAASSMPVKFILDSIGRGKPLVFAGRPGDQHRPMLFQKIREACDLVL